MSDYLIFVLSLYKKFYKHVKQKQTAILCSCGHIFKRSCTSLKDEAMNERQMHAMHVYKENTTSPEDSKMTF